MMKKKSIAFILILSLLFTFSVPGIATAAKTESELKDELSDIKEEKNKLSEEMTRVEEAAEEATEKVRSLSNRISQTTQEIAEIKAKIAAKEEEMNEREENLNERLAVMYKNGSIGFVDVLLGSGSISEFVSNVEMIKRIYANDIKVMEALQEEYEELEKIKAELKEKKASLAADKVEMEKEKADLEEKKKDLKEQEDALKAEADRITSEIKKLQDASKPFVGGVFSWPCPASQYITSSFGNRLHPVLNQWIFHTGIDIGASSGSSIVAAASGTVIMASWYGGYGNCIMVDHGGGIVTLYGHCSGYACSTGQAVSKGQTIGYVGSTGRSTGPHLHFEVRNNGSYVNPLSYFS